MPVGSMLRGLIVAPGLWLLVGAVAHPKGVAQFPPQAAESSGQAELQALHPLAEAGREAVRATWSM